MTTDQRMCTVRFCGHPESSHFCEDDGGPEPYHGDDWCEDCVGVGTAHEFKPPTPTSSLEEARQAFREWRIEKWGPEESDGSPLKQPDPRNAPTQPEAYFIGGFERGKAAARAEVIREVDSWLDDGIAYREASGDDAVVSAFKTLKLFIARLRALSQGGEGKA